MITMNYEYIIENKAVAVAEYVKSFSDIKDTEVVFFNNFAIIGIRTLPFFTLSEKKNFVGQLKNDIKTKFSIENVLVNVDSDIFYKLMIVNANAGSGDLEEIMREIIRRENSV